MPRTFLANREVGDRSRPPAARRAGVGLIPHGHRALDPLVRERYEYALGTNLAEVRIHDDAAAAASARSVGATAYAAGRDIVFGAGYQPRSLSGERLLAHELAHVVQQEPGGGPAADQVSSPGDAAEREAVGAVGDLLAGRPPRLSKSTLPVAIYRQSVEQHASETGPAAEAQVRQWLDQHQFAQPQDQPAEGERHALLNGEEMTVSAAVRLAVAALNQPESVVRGVILAALAPPMPQTALGATWVGRGNRVPGLPLFQDTPGDRVRVQKALEIQTLDEWLDRHSFTSPEIRDPLGDRVVIDGENSTIERVADRAMAVLGGPRMTFLTRPEILTHLRQRYVAARGGPQTQLVFGYTFVPTVLQAVTPNDPANPLRRQHQFSVTITRAHHPGDSPGLESSFQGSVTFNEAGDIMNIQGGGQLAFVDPLLRGWIQVSGFVQTMASVNWSKSGSGTAVITPAVMTGVGAQALLTPNFRGGPFAFLNGRVQVGAQVTAGVQFSPQSDPGGTSLAVQAGVTGGLVFNIPFSL
jgi:uncharacterized protein DUF4157